MSKPITNVTLKFPCTEDWNKMDTSSGERICSRCQHKVVDFTNMSDEEYQLHLKNAQHVCGRFKKSQLSSEFLKYAAATIIAASALGATSCDTVEPAQVETIPTTETEEIAIEFVTVGIPIPPPFDTTAVYLDPPQEFLRDEVKEETNEE